YDQYTRVQFVCCLQPSLYKNIILSSTSYNLLFSFSNMHPPFFIYSTVQNDSHIAKKENLRAIYFTFRFFSRRFFKNSLQYDGEIDFLSFYYLIYLRFILKEYYFCTLWQQYLSVVAQMKKLINYKKQRQQKYQKKNLKMTSNKGIKEKNKKKHRKKRMILIMMSH